MTLYAMSKAALIGFTKGLARDLGPRGITVNIVHPGSTDTDMNPATGEHADAQRARMAIPRYGKPEDIAGLVAYLASEEARFITDRLRDRWRRQYLQRWRLRPGARLCCVSSNHAVIPGRPKGSSPEPITAGRVKEGAPRDRSILHRQRLWVPGSSLRQAPE